MYLFVFITLFPEYFHNYFSLSIAKKTIKKKTIEYKVYNLRDFSDKGNVDDYIYGGGSGMLLKVDVIYEAIYFLRKEYKNIKIILLDPQGKKITQFKIEKIVKKYNKIAFICGHYEGFDTRVKKYVDEIISVGDFVTMGGEIPSLLLVDSLIRLIPGVIKEDSYQEDSFSSYNKNKFDYDSYTRPSIFREEEVPEVLLSGNHKMIKEWRDENSLNKLKKKWKKKKQD